MNVDRHVSVRIVARMSNDAPTDPSPPKVTIIAQSDSLNELFAALAIAQGEMQTAEMSANNPHFKKPYADLADIWAACRPALSKNGLAVIQLPHMAENGRIGVAAMLGHKSGQWIMTRLEATAQVSNPQAIGSVITYLRRYTLAPIAGVAVRGEDDDGEVGEGRGSGGRDRSGDRTDPPRNAAPSQARPTSRPAEQPTTRQTTAPAQGQPAQGQGQRQPPPIPEGAKQWVDRFNAETNVDAAKKLRTDTREMFADDSAEGIAVKYAWGQCARRLGITKPAAPAQSAQGQGQ